MSKTIYFISWNQSWYSRVYNMHTLCAPNTCARPCGRCQKRVEELVYQL